MFVADYQCTIKSQSLNPLVFSPGSADVRIHCEQFCNDGLLDDTLLWDTLSKLVAITMQKFKIQMHYRQMLQKVDLTFINTLREVEE